MLMLLMLGASTVRFMTFALGIGTAKAARRSVGRVPLARYPTHVQPASARETKGCELLTNRHEMARSSATLTDTEA